MKRERITNILLGIIVILLGVYLYVIVSQQGLIEVKINSAVKESVRENIKKIELPKPIAGYTPVKGIDYFDGVNGNNATNEQVRSAVQEYFAANPVKNGENGTNGNDAPIPVKGVDYNDGLTPTIRCNATKNRWEVRYDAESAWQLLNNEKVKCTIGE